MTDKQKLYKQLREYKEQIESKGHDVVYVGLYGSQNYNLHDEDSDIDARAIVLPTVKQLLTNGTVSTTFDFDTGQVDTKDVITFCKTLGKGNPAYIESADTEIWIGDKKLRKLIEGWNYNPRAVVGMMQEKLKAIEKGLPASSPMIEKIGYDPKQYHHILRLADYLDGYKWYEGDYRNLMLNVKRNGYSDLDITKETAKDIINNCLESYDMTFKPNEISDEIYKYVENAMIEKLFKPHGELHAEQTRTFNGNVPKKHKEMFEELEQYDGKDITYCIYSYLEMLDYDNT